MFSMNKASSSIASGKCALSKDLEPLYLLSLVTYKRPRCIKSLLYWVKETSDRFVYLNGEQKAFHYDVIKDIEFKVQPGKLLNTYDLDTIILKILTVTQKWMVIYSNDHISQFTEQLNSSEKNQLNNREMNYSAFNKCTDTQIFKLQLGRPYIVTWRTFIIC